MPRKKNRRKSASQKAPATLQDKILRLWGQVKLQDSPSSRERDRAYEAEDRLNQLLRNAFARGKMGTEEVVSVVNESLDPALLRFIHECSGHAFLTDGKTMIQGQAFIIPVVCDVSDFADRVGNNIMDLTRAIRASGVSQDKSNVVLLPHAYIVDQMADIEYQSVFRSCVDLKGRGLPAPYETPSDTPKGTMGMRFLIGFRHHVLDKEDGAEPDNFYPMTHDGDFLGDLPDVLSDDRSALFESLMKRQEVFRDTAREILGNRDIFMSPVTWEDAPERMVDNIYKMDQMIFGDDIQFTLNEEGEDFLVIKAWQQGIMLDQTPFRTTLLTLIEEDGIKDIVDKYDILLEEPRSDDGPAFH